MLLRTFIIIQDNQTIITTIDNTKSLIEISRDLVYDYFAKTNGTLRQASKFYKDCLIPDDAEATYENVIYEFVKIGSISVIEHGDEFNILSINKQIINEKIQ